MLELYFLYIALVKGVAATMLFWFFYVGSFFFPHRCALPASAEKKAFDRKVAANFMKGMVTKRIVTPTRATIKAVMPMPKPQKKAMPLTKDVARKRIMAMKGLTGRNKFSLVNRLSLNQHSPRRVVRLARELARLR